VLQGWELRDYARCVALYRGVGLRLCDCPVVGVSSVCRRQATEEIGELVDPIAARFPIHALGVKTLGLARYGDALSSALALPAARMQLVITTGLAAAPHVTPEVALGFGLRICSA
jgi:hypothetical protein